MKKIVTLVLMIIMMFSFSLTAYAYKKDPVYSPSGKPVTEEGAVVETSPQTGEQDMVLYGLGAAAAVFASSAVIIRKKAM